MTNYWGGKKRLSYQFLPALLDHIQSQERKTGKKQLYLEPFLGMGSVLRTLVENSNHHIKTFIGCDEDPRIITFWEEIKKGWTPPRQITHKQYKALKESKDEGSVLHSFIGHSCGFHGIYFRGNAPAQRVEQMVKRNYKTVNKVIDILEPRWDDIHFLNVDFFDMDPPENAIIYLDPPYKGSTDASAGAGFNTDKFWKQAELWSNPKYGNIVIVSEAQAPSGQGQKGAKWRPIWEKPHLHGHNGTQYTRTEYLLAWF